MMMSGSWRRNARNARANVRPVDSLIGTCMMPSMSYSTGSSEVSNFMSMVLMRFRHEYNVVVFPDPVGPVTMKMPLGTLMTSFVCSKISGGIPRLSNSRLTTVRSRTRSTTDSPYCVRSEEHTSELQSLR